MSKKPRILLIATSNLFGESLEFLLRQANVVETIVTEEFRTFDETANPQWIANIKSDIVLLATDEATYQTGRQIASKILELHPEICIIHTDRSQNTFYIHSTRALPARVTNLLEAIRSIAIV